MKISRLIAVILVFGGGIGSVWFAWGSINQRLETIRMQACFRGAEEALARGQRRQATAGFRQGIAFFEKSRRYRGFYPDAGREYLTAGNCYWRMSRPRVALDCYERGLRRDPFSISLLTSYGNCAYSLGEWRKAQKALEQSDKVFPLAESARARLALLREKNE